MQNWKNSRLQDYLLYDEWQPFFGWCILVGFDGELGRAKSFDSVDLATEYLLDNTSAIPINDKYIDSEQVQAMLNDIDRLRDFWQNARRGNECESPSFFIDWALSKRFRPNWLDWAIEEKLYLPMNEPSKVQTIIFDTITTYPSELDLANKAWQAVSSNEGKGKPKAQIRAWLDANTKELSNEAKERISIVCNWDKLGGATRTD